MLRGTRVQFPPPKCSLTRVSSLFNRYRLIGRVFYSPPPFQGRIYVLRVMDHQEYDKGNWVNDCGCHKPPPKKPAIATTVSPKGKPAPHGQRKGK